MEKTPMADDAEGRIHGNGANVVVVVDVVVVVVVINVRRRVVVVVVVQSALAQIG